MKDKHLRKTNQEKEVQKHDQFVSQLISQQNKFKAAQNPKSAILKFKLLTFVDIRCKLLTFALDIEPFPHQLLGLRELQNKPKHTISVGKK